MALASSSLSSASKIISIPLQWHAGFLPQALWFSTNSLSPQAPTQFFTLFFSNHGECGWCRFPDSLEPAAFTEVLFVHLQLYRWARISLSYLV